MTDEFIKKMEKAMEKGVELARKEDMEYISKREANTKFATLYEELVLAFVEEFNFHTNSFNCNAISKEFLKQFGHPKSISARIDEDKQLGEISFDYGNADFGLKRAGEPGFKSDPSFDLKIVRDILKENGIYVYENHYSADMTGSNEDVIYFDASMLIATRNKLIDESPKNHRTLAKQETKEEIEEKNDRLKEIIKRSMNKDN